MTSRRVYLPLNPSRLAALHEAGRIDGAVIGYAPTPALAALLPGGADEEEQEYAATQEAATVAAALGDLVVAAIDIPAAEFDAALTDAAQPGDSPAAVRLSGPVLLRQVASLHRLDPPGERDPDADLGLSWYDVTELPQLAAELG